jgi:hypothetical protein
MTTPHGPAVRGARLSDEVRDWPTGWCMPGLCGASRAIEGWGRQTDEHVRGG